MSSTVAADVSSDGLRLVSDEIEVRASLPHGTLGVTDASGWRPLPAAFASVELEDGTSLSTRGREWSIAARPARFEDAHGPGVRAVLRTEAEAGLRLHLELAVYEGRPFALLRLGLENVGTTARSVRRLSPLVSESEDAVRPSRFFRHGWQAWTPSLSLSSAQQDIGARPPVHAPVPPPSGRGAFASEEAGVLFDAEAGRSLLLGFVSARDQWTQVRVTGGRSVEAAAFADGSSLLPGTTLWSERLLVEATDGAEAALARYAEVLAREMGARVPASPVAGWCSWYYYFRDVTERDILAQLRFLQEHRDALPLEYVQIDDGYQADIGDWAEANEKFPHGMAWLAREIKDAGFKPGLWFAPFLAGAHSRLFAEHPDWVVGVESGRPVAAKNWGQDCYALDTTHPSAEAWLRDLFREATEGWGYDYVKVDFLYGAAVAGRRHDADATRIQAYRRGLQAIRDGAGERFVLGCGALMGPSVGLVDGQRIGPDVAPWWRFRRRGGPRHERGRPDVGGEPSTENALRNVFTRSWMHGRLWANDPDCLLARAERTKLTLPEVQSLATAIALSGGMVLLSDDLTRLPSSRLDLVSLLLPPLGEAGTARGLMTEAMPSALELEVSRPFETWWLLGQFNWQRRRRDLAAELPEGSWHVFELWKRRYLGEHEGGVALPDVPSHGVRLLALRCPLPHPQLLGTTFHASMGGRELASSRFDPERSVLRLDLEPVAKRHGEVFIHMPPQFRFKEALLDAEPVPPRRIGPAVVALRFALRAPSSLEVSFAERD